MENNKLVSFYQSCMEKGYVDMSDATQSLKAKVIASDLGLNYKNIDKLYNEAKLAYENHVVAEEKRKQQLEEEEARKAVNGNLLFTLDTSESEIKVYRRPDESVYCEGPKTGGRIEKVKISTESGAYLSYDYHPSKTVYTGASSGGIHMGGTHTTEAYYSEKVTTSSNGDVVIQYGDKKETVHGVRLSGAVAKAFKRDEAYLKWGSDFACRKSELSQGLTAKAIISSDAGFYDKMGMLSASADMMRLPMAECKEIAKFLNRIITHQYPLSDEQIYAQGKQLLAQDNSAALQQAINKFQIIKDYLDSKELIEQAMVKYEEVLQAEKENKILQQEAKAEKREKTIKKIIPVIIILCVLIVAGSIIFKISADKKQAELEAVSMEYMQQLIGKTYYREDGLSITFNEDGTALGKWSNGFYSTYDVWAEAGDPVVLTLTLIPEKSKVESDEPVSYATWDMENDEIKISNSIYKSKSK